MELGPGFEPGPYDYETHMLANYTSRAFKVIYLLRPFRSKRFELDYQFLRSSMKPKPFQIAFLDVL